MTDRKVNAIDDFCNRKQHQQQQQQLQQTALDVTYIIAWTSRLPRYGTILNRLAEKVTNAIKNAQ